ncbi:MULTISPECIES: zeta toxin family protein [unclassified Staphylococcus]|uniref:zeta toxin family protein n=1 Tax=unclassified Staphylococcus TaxID=91994 RepID=UPI0021CF7029|nr:MULTISPECIES: zeta toxin family protein [unclassified Staphylococcus]UXR68861.1 zeta toxin family protein [Staphylococcus sp. IVB6246]UXR70918.1 zeta toxin family protein [Staphylococcus sp. IVB6240]UXR73148.1 zeta toxin family protein [Staphylococcus sp. IVB6238]UXR75444.1 zeta toxin family protein [Staphylococcus sp. IVB6233]UXR79647.1 zeta toxin family protein [Staphylococcus sp. IVB6218]
MTLKKFSQSEINLAFKRLTRSLTRGKTISTQPKAILLGGQSGAGKTTLHRMKQKEFQGNIIIIDVNSYQSLHPNYLNLQKEFGKESVHYTKKFAGKMVELLIEELSKQSYHLLIEGTLRTTAVPRETAQLLKSLGYEVSLALIATKPELSYLSTLIRYEELYRIDPTNARATPMEHHDEIVKNLPMRLKELENDQIFKRIQIYQRDKHCVYDSAIDDASAVEILKECLFGQWSEVENEMLRLSSDRLRELTCGNDRSIDTSK